MSNSDQEELQTFVRSVIEDFTLWESVWFCLWTCSLFACKLARYAAGVLERWFLDSFFEEDQQSVEVLADGPVGDSTGDVSISSELESPIKPLIPLLPDEIVREQVWPILMNQLSVPLLLLLRHVSKSWNSFIVTTPE